MIRVLRVPRATDRETGMTSLTLIALIPQYQGDCRLRERTDRKPQAGGILKSINIGYLTSGIGIQEIAL